MPAIIVAESTASPNLETFSKAHEIPFVRLGSVSRDIFNQQITKTCIDAELDLLCLTFDKIIPAELVGHYRGRVINVHPGLLPAFKGMRAVEQALASDARFVGATVHEVDEEMDHGSIIAQYVIGVRSDDSAQRLGDRMFGFLRLMFLQVIGWYAQERIVRNDDGQLRVKDAIYGEYPISPAIELGFPD